MTLPPAMDDYDFNDPPPLRGTGSCKWDAPRGEGVLPLWVADMDFAAPPPVLRALPHSRQAA